MNAEEIAMKCPPMPSLQYERAPCPKCGAANEEQAGAMCRPVEEQTGERECATDFHDGWSVKPTAQSILDMDAWIDAHHNCDVECIAWQPAETAPKDGHFLACQGPYSEHWGFNQSPPFVVHYWGNPGEEGFYLSCGIVEGSYNDMPFTFTHWRPLGDTPRGQR